MGHYALQFFIGQGAHNTCRCRYGGMLRITAGRKGVWYIRIHEVDLGHRHIGLSGQINHHAI